MRKKRLLSLPDRRAVQAVLALQWREVKIRVKRRDRGRCRICGAQGQRSHHIIFRRDGGPDRLRNTVYLCTPCEQDVHEGRMRLTGNPNQTHGLIVQRVLPAHTGPGVKRPQAR